MGGRDPSNFVDYFENINLNLFLPEKSLLLFPLLSLFFSHGSSFSAMAVSKVAFTSGFYTGRKFLVKQTAF